jgi:hypothetical protein
MILVLSAMMILELPYPVWVAPSGLQLGQVQEATLQVVLQAANFAVELEQSVEASIVVGEVDHQKS